MSSDLQIIIQEIKALGYLFTNKQQKTQIQPEEDDQNIDKRRFRLSFGDRVYVSKEFGLFKSTNQLCFYEPYHFFYDNHSRILNIEIFKEHQFGKNDDYKFQLNAEIDLSDFSVIKGDYIEAILTDVYGSSMGRLLLVVDVFKKGPRFYEKVVSSVLFQKVKQEVERQEREHKVSAAGKNIRNLIVNNQLSNFLMTINSMHVIPEIEDTQIFNKQCTVLIKYGPLVKAYTKLTKSQNKDSTSFMDYLEFTKNQDLKFQFFFIFIDELGSFICKARGEIKYIIFDETINAHSVVLFDKRSTKYGMLMVKFIEKEVEGNPNIMYKTDRKIKQNENAINQAIDTFNRFKFQAKYNNHVLSEKISELELLRQKQEEEKNRPMNQQQKRKAEQHKKFIQFLQKQVLRIERELQKREQKNKQVQRKEKYLPNVMAKKAEKGSAVNKSMHVSGSSSQFRDGKTKLPKV